MFDFLLHLVYLLKNFSTLKKNSLFYYNPRKPVESFAAHFKVLTICGLWPPVDASAKIRRLYNIYSWFCLTVWLYIFVYTQFMYFFEIQDLTDLANSLYFFLIQIVLIPKLYYLKKNGDRIRKCIEQLKSDLFLSENEEEDKCDFFFIYVFNVKVRIFFCSKGSLSMQSFAQSCFTAWKSQCVIPVSLYGPSQFLSRAVEKLNWFPLNFHLMWHMAINSFWHSSTKLSLSVTVHSRTWQWIHLLQVCSFMRHHRLIDSVTS